jgi:LuxR family maltose regulon positive regulatory protein
LLARIQHGGVRPLLLIVAPAGFGKTTLVSEWLQALPAGSPGAPAFINPQVAWLSLDEDDNDPIRFLHYLIAALQTRQPSLGEVALSWLAAPQTPPLRAILTPLLNDLGALTTPLALVLDDYHLINAAPIHEALAFFIDHLPPRFQLIITSRVDPPLPLARWRARNQLIEIRTADLRFTPDEAAVFLNQRHGLPLTSAEIATLATRTEGWIAGLQLAALSLQGRADPAALIQTFSGSHRYIVDYLVAEALQQQPPRVQTFLLQTAILNRLSAALCNALTGRSDGQTRLKQLEQANLFIVPLDEERHWYRYHQLFADALRTRQRELAADTLPTLHRRASHWYAEQGLISEAIHHALLAADFAAAVRLIEPVAQRMIAAGESLTLLRWLQSLPAPLVQTNAPLAVASALAHLVAGHLDAIQPLLGHAEAALQQADPSTSQGVRNEFNAIHALITIEQGTTPDALTLARQALAHLPAENLFLRGALAYSLGMAYRAGGETRAASHSFAEARAIGFQHNHWLTALIASYELAESLLEQGELRRAQAIHQEALAWVAAPGGAAGEQPLPLAGAAHIGLGKLSYEWNDLAMARQQLELGIKLAQPRGGLGLARQGLPTLALVAQAQGNDVEARRLLEQAEELARQSPRADAVARLQPDKARLWLAQGDLAAAWRWAQEEGREAHHPPLYPREADYAMLARVYLTQPTPGHLAQATHWVTQALQVAAAHGRQGRVIELLLLQALVCQAQNDNVAALAWLQRSLTLAEPEGYIRTFVDEGEPLRQLLAKCAAHLTQQAGADRRLHDRLLPYLQRLLAAFPAARQDSGQIVWEAPKGAPRHPPLATRHLIEPLTEREVAVLHLIVAGLSNREIAEQLIIAEGTVKKYTHNIFGKLGVQRRAQAIARAAELGLL